MVLISVGEGVPADTPRRAHTRAHTCKHDRVMSTHTPTVWIYPLLQLTKVYPQPVPLLLDTDALEEADSQQLSGGTRTALRHRGPTCRSSSRHLWEISSFVARASFSSSTVFFS